jgi:superfamily II RNA helicase
MSGRAGRRGLDTLGKVIMYYYNDSSAGQYRDVLPKECDIK